MTIQLRRNTAAGAAGNNAVLALGEPGFDQTNKVFKIGDGVTHWNDLPPIASAMQPLVVSGKRVTVGGIGPSVKLTGYNSRVLPGEYPSPMTLDTQDKLEDFFRRQPEGSLHRFPAYLPGTGSGHTQASTLAILDNLVATAYRYKQRLAFRTTNWVTVGGTPGVVDRFDNKDQTFWTASPWSIANNGSASLEAWQLLLAARYVGYGGVLSFLGLCNEPTVSGGNTNAARDWVAHMAAAVHAVNPGVLVQLEVNLVGSVGGQAAYQTIAAGVGGVGLDICSGHNYNPYGFLTSADPILVTAQALNKPVWYDENGIISKGYYGSSGDSDKDSSGRPGVPSSAQAAQVERFYNSTIALDECMGLCYYSWPATQTDGLAHLEPLAGSLTRKVLREIHPEGDGFSFESIGAITAWFDASQNTLTQTGVAVPTWQYRHANSSAAIAGPAPTSGRFAGVMPSFRFNGSQYIDGTPWKTGSAVATGHWCGVPLVNPVAGSYAYLTGPQALTGLASGVRINSAGQVEIIHTSAASSTAGTVVATSTNSVVLDEPNTLQWQWDTGNGGIIIILNDVLTVVAGATASLTVGNARIGCGADGLNGFIGHMFEGIHQTIAETMSNIFLVSAYMLRRYREFPVTGTGKTYTDQQIAAQATLTMQVPAESFASGDCWIMAGQGATPGTLLLTQAREIATPFYLPHAVTIAKLATEVTTVGSAGALVRLGIRAHDTTTGVAGALLVDGGTIDGTVLGVDSVTLGAPLTLAAGWYWYSQTGQGAPTTQATVRDLVAASVQFPVPLKAASFAALGTIANQMVFQSAITAALPGTFTSAGFLAAGPRMLAQAQ